MINEEATFTTTAVQGEKCYDHFGIHPVTANMYGHKPEDIVNLEFVISKNQEKPLRNSECIAADYWAWYDFKDEEFSLIYAQRFLLDMCFPAGISGTEKFGEGKAYRIEIINQ